MLFNNFILGTEIENTEVRTNTIKDLIQQLPSRNFHLLKIIVKHLRNVANHSQKNLMTVSNLGICFAPTLMRGPDENSLSMGEVKYSNVVANTLIEKYDSIFNDPRLDQAQNLTQPSIRHNSVLGMNKYDEQFGLEIAGQRYQEKQPSIPNVNNGNKPFRCYEGSNDLAQFALTSRPNTFIFNSIPSIDIRPINDLKTYSYDQAVMVPAEQSYQQLGGSMNNSLNHVGYLGSQTSSHPNSLSYSSNSLNNGLYAEQLNTSVPMSTFRYGSHQANKMLYRSDKVITLYACVADTESELTFGPNEVITDGES